MREIKFKYTCKRENGHIFSEIFTLAEIEKGNIALWFTVNKIGSNDKVFKSQYIDHPDKNGMEIYEGAIVKHTNNDDFFEVIWVNVSWQVRNLRTKFTFMLFDFENIEVIGDIYENPELKGNTHD